MAREWLARWWTSEALMRTAVPEDDCVTALQTSVPRNRSSICGDSTSRRTPMYRPRVTHGSHMCDTSCLAVRPGERERGERGERTAEWGAHQALSKKKLSSSTPSKAFRITAA
jgi:hypothetical protein